jgi:hypothetical protein
MSRLGLLHRIHGERANRVDAFPVERGIGHRRRGMGKSVGGRNGRQDSSPVVGRPRGILNWTHENNQPRVSGLWGCVPLILSDLTTGIDG